LQVFDKKPGAVEAGYLDRIRGIKTGFDKKLKFTQFGKPRAS